MVLKSEVTFIRIGTGDRFIRYKCDKCSMYHTQSIDARCETLIRKGMKQNVTLVLWCGKGTEPDIEALDVLTIKIVPIKRMSKKEQSTIRNYMKSLGTASIGINWGHDTPIDLISFAEEQMKKIDERMQVLEGNKKNIEKQKQKLEELLNMR